LAETGDAAQAAIDGGRCEIGLESTVVALLGAPPRLLRPGAVTREALEAVIGPLADAHLDARRSPGRATRHYAPGAPLRLAVRAPKAGEAFLAFGPAAPGPMVFNLSPSADLTEAAANFFSFLRAADALAPVAIAVAEIPRIGLGEAINDRLERAAGRVG
jgi:L-threonylcarbamoyladenylate synthase